MDSCTISLPLRMTWLGPAESSGATRSRQEPAPRNLLLRQGLCRRLVAREARTNEVVELAEGVEAGSLKVPWDAQPFVPAVLQHPRRKGAGGDIYAVRALTASHDLLHGLVPAMGRRMAEEDPLFIEGDGDLTERPKVPSVRTGAIMTPSTCFSMRISRYARSFFGENSVLQMSRLYPCLKLICSIPLMASAGMRLDAFPGSTAMFFVLLL